MKLRFLIASVGSLGDALPYLHLACHLQQLGHEVRLFCNDEHRKLIEEAGIAFVSAGADVAYSKTLSNPNLWHPIHGMGVLWRGMLAPSIASLYRAIENLPKDGAPWHILAGPHMLGARLAQENLGVRLTSLYTAPSMLRTHIAPTTIAHSFWPKYTSRWLLKAMWSALDRYKLDPMARPKLELICAELNIAPPPRHISLFGKWVHSTQCGITLFPAWFSEVPIDQAGHIVSGDFPLLTNRSSIEALSDDLEKFLNAGSPPFVVMLGSAMAHAAHLYACWQEVALALDQRAILINAQTHQLPKDKHPNIMTLPFAPFDLLLSRSSLLVHHGGIGSCIQALAAGVPQIIQPHSHDQFENARCAEALGAAVKISRKATAENMRNALHAAWEPDRQKSVRAIKTKMTMSSISNFERLLIE